jgi:hypothetical protein
MMEVTEVPCSENSFVLRGRVVRVFNPTGHRDFVVREYTECQIQAYKYLYPLFAFMMGLLVGAGTIIWRLV